MSASIAGSSFVLYYNLARAQMKIPRNREKFNIDVESLPTIINLDNVPSLSSTPEDSGFERSSGSANSEHINVRKCLPFGKDNPQNEKADNDTLIIRNPSPDTQLYDEGYFDLVKKNYLAWDLQTPVYDSQFVLKYYKLNNYTQQNYSYLIGLEECK